MSGSLLKPRGEALRGHWLLVIGYRLLQRSCRRAVALAKAGPRFSRNNAVARGAHAPSRAVFHALAEHRKACSPITGQ